MTRKNLFTGLAGTFALLLASVAAYSQTVRTWDGGGADDKWGTAANWSSDNVPDSVGEIAQFEAENGLTVELDNDFTIGDLEVISRSGTHSDVTLQSDDLDGSPTRRTLTLDADATAGSTEGQVIIDQSNVLTIGAQVTLKFADAEADSEIGGSLELGDASTEFLMDDNVTFGPENPGGTPVYGEVVGLDSSALIEIADGKTLTNEITIEGEMLIDAENVGMSPSATFDNASDGDTSSGIVRASRNGVLQFGDSSVSTSLTVNDNADSLWEASTDADAKLRFETEPVEDGSCPADVLAGEFAIYDCADLSFGVDIETTGTLDHNAGVLEVDSGSCFTYERCDFGETQVCDGSVRVQCD